MLVESPSGLFCPAGSFHIDPTCAAFEPVRCDTFVSESAFGLPIYRWDGTAEVIAGIAPVASRFTRALRLGTPWSPPPPAS